MKNQMVSETHNILVRNDKTTNTLRRKWQAKKNPMIRNSKREGEASIHKHHAQLYQRTECERDQRTVANYSSSDLRRQTRRKHKTTEYQDPKHLTEDGKRKWAPAVMAKK